MGQVWTLGHVLVVRVWHSWSGVDRGQVWRGVSSRQWVRCGEGLDLDSGLGASFNLFSSDVFIFSLFNLI